MLWFGVSLFSFLAAYLIIDPTFWYEAFIKRI